MKLHGIQWIVPTLLICCGGSGAGSSDSGPDQGESHDTLDSGPVHGSDVDQDIPDSETGYDGSDPAGNDTWEVVQDPGSPLNDSADDIDSDLADADIPDIPWPGPGDGYRTHGSYLVDPEGRSMIPHGINVANASKYLPERFSWHTAEDFRDLASHGFDSVRLLTFWGAIMPERDFIDGAYLDEYVKRVRWAAEAGLSVVVDMHQDIFGFGFGENGAPLWACDQSLYDSFQRREPWYLNYMAPEVRQCFDRFYGDDEIFDRFRDAWVAVAERVRDEPAVMGFDLLNEPNWGGAPDIDAWLSDTWQPRMEALTLALRQAAPGKVVFWQGSTMFSVGHVDRFSPPGIPDVSLGAHYYHPLVHDGGEYDRDSMADHIDLALDAMAESGALLGGVPVWMGEMGGPVGSGNFDLYMTDLLERLASRGWGWAVWSDDRGGFGIREPSGEWRTDYIRQLTHPWTRRVPGPFTDAGLDAQSDVFHLTFSWEVEAPLELWTGPASGGDKRVRVVPLDGGPQVSCTAADGMPEGVVRCLPAGLPADWKGRLYQAETGPRPAGSM